MRTPNNSRAALSRLGAKIVAVLVVTACAGDATAPITPPASGFTPASAGKALIDATDGTYTFTIDPSRHQSLQIGQSHLDIPAGAICNLEDSGYGPKFWNQECVSEDEPVRITATVRGADTDHPRIDFQPALRFSPKTDVRLFMFVDNATTGDDWQILYCPTAGARCIDEAKSDPSLVAHVEGELVTRRIKHFSGYVVAERYF